MKKEIYRLKNFSFFLKSDKELSKEEKCQMHDLLVKTFPPFRALYDKYGYYSSAKPQMEFLIREGDKFIGAGKLLWRNVKVGNERIKLFGFGMIIDELYQGQGIGTELALISKEEARKRGADILYASTDNKKAERIFKKLGFEKLKTKVIYKDVETKEIKNSKHSYVFEFKKGLINKLNKLGEFYVGVGSI